MVSFAGETFANPIFIVIVAVLLGVHGVMPVGRRITIRAGKGDINLKRVKERICLLFPNNFSLIRFIRVYAAAASAAARNIADILFV